jgi:hypothetical protein
VQAPPSTPLAEAEATWVASRSGPRPWSANTAARAVGGHVDAVGAGEAAEPP